MEAAGGETLNVNGGRRWDGLEKIGKNDINATAKKKVVVGQTLPVENSAENDKNGSISLPLPES